MKLTSYKKDKEDTQNTEPEFILKETEFIIDRCFYTRSNSESIKIKVLEKGLKIPYRGKYLNTLVTTEVGFYCYVRSEDIEEVKAPEPEITYPCLMEHPMTGTIILFNKQNTGVCLWANKSITYVYSKMGEYSDGWAQRDFKPYYGDMTLRYTEK